MSLYHSINKLSITKTLRTLDELSEKFPMLKVKDVDFYSLARHYRLKGKDFYCMVVFMDGVRHLKAMDTMNNNMLSFVIDMNEVHQINVKKQGNDQWIFDVVHGKKKEKLSFSHVFEF